MSYYRYLGSHLFLDKLTPFICVNIEPTSFLFVRMRILPEDFV